jgi:SAM-dependent methyltransferase
LRRRRKALPEEVEEFVAEAPIHRRPLTAIVAAAAAATPPGSDVLDAGAGRAPYRSLFDHCRYVAQDWPSSVHGSARIDVVADLRDLPLEDRTFDLVLCTEVLEHLPDPRPAMAEMRRVLRPGGRLIVTVPFVIELHEEPYDYLRYTSYALRALVEDAGLEVDDVRPLTGWWSTLASVLANARTATGNGSGARPIGAGALAALASYGGAALGRVAPRLDRADGRHALPLGWSCTARRP